ncbi:hypothetical protein QBK99_13360 [Corticibacterium sp. UT-5YL-CI-8]|nr:hypothetical protein [Tianweitania sp. UT-5YL-CI-8]
MSLRPPQKFTAGGMSNSALDVLEYEFLAEKASALGQTGQRVVKCLDALKAHSGSEEERAALLKAAADAVYGYFIQRELCGFRRHEDVIREYAIPREVLARLGAK